MWTNVVSGPIDVRVCQIGKQMGLASSLPPTDALERALHVGHSKGSELQHATIYAVLQVSRAAQYRAARVESQQNARRGGLACSKIAIWATQRAASHFFADFCSVTYQPPFCNVSNCLPTTPSARTFSLSFAVSHSDNFADRQHFSWKGFVLVIVQASWLKTLRLMQRRVLRIPIEASWKSQFDTFSNVTWHSTKGVLIDTIETRLCVSGCVSAQLLSAFVRVANWFIRGGALILRCDS